MATRWIAGRVRAMGLTGPAYRAFELSRLLDPRLARRNLRYRGRLAPDGLPVPPPRLIVLVAGSPDIAWFLDYGRRTTDAVRQILARNGVAIERFRAILDFGCGCGRMVRHWKDLAAGGVAIAGTDYNPRLVGWCRQNLPFARFSTNDLAPPLDAVDAAFDFIYAFSVFTHLTEPLQRAWIDELARVLEPGGYLLLTTHGESYLEQLSDEEQAAFRAGRLVVRHAEVAGANLCAAFHPRVYIASELARGFDLIDFAPVGAIPGLLQDVTLLRKPPRS
jgi:SAM-dependent methyltransferase